MLGFRENYKNMNTSWSMWKANSFKTIPMDTRAIVFFKERSTDELILISPKTVTSF